MKSYIDRRKFIKHSLAIYTGTALGSVSISSILF
jgi:hypothetical protein